MPGRRVPPPHRFQPVHGYEQGLSKGLVMAFPMLEGSGNTAVNYGLWGHEANLTLAPGASWSSREGFSNIKFSSASAAANVTFGHTIPQTWSYAFWGKLDTAPSGAATKNAFTFEGSSMSNLRVQADTTGMWLWQRRATADTYSILSSSDYMGDGVRLFVGTFTGIDTQPPVQLRTSAGMSMQPLQPSAYTAFNVGVGAQQTEVVSFHIGNDGGGTSPWDGVIGPFYFWDRVISDAEVWQLWQDPYAPLRRRTGHLNLPSLMTPLPDYSKSGAVTGKPRYDNQIFTDSSALFIILYDNHFYLDRPTDGFGDGTGAQEPNTIVVNDTHSYSAISMPMDAFLSDGSGAQEPIIIDLSDNHIYTSVPLPADLVVSADTTDTITPTLIEVVESHTYISMPTDSFGFTPPGDTGAQTPIVINISEDWAYLDDPVENIVSDLQNA